ncbi:MAG: spore germination protein GerW family protein [Acidimicrobiales bacterium]
MSSTVLDRLDGARDAFTVKRVFGDPYEQNGVTVIPVAAVRGAGGGGEGAAPEGAARPGSGAGMGFAVNARPLGVYVVRGDDVTWQPAVDTTRMMLARLAAVLAGMLVLRSVVMRLLRAMD